MSIQLQEVLKTDTLEIQRQKFNTLALDTFNILAGGTNLNVGTIGIDDGTLSAPGLYFGNEPTLGLYRPTQYKMGFVAENTLLMSIGDHEYNSLAGVNPTVNVYSNLNTFAENAIVAGSFSGGSGYTKGTYTNVAALGGGGGGALMTIEVSGLIGSITNAGSEYVPGNYSNVPFQNVSNTADVISGTLTGPGVGYAAGTYTNVPLTGGLGLGAEATIVVDALLQQVTSVTITNSGSGYAIGDILSADPNFDGVGGGGGFSYTLDSVQVPPAGGAANILIDHIAGTIPAGAPGVPGGEGSGYIPGTYTDIPLTGGTGTNAIATITVTGSQVVTGSINGGSGYQDGTYTNVSLYNTPTVTYAVTVIDDPLNVQLNYRLNGLDQPALTLDIGNTYRFDLSDSSLVGHPFNFENALVQGPLPTGVTLVANGTQGSPGAFVDLVISPLTSVSDQVNYYCSVHVGMGNTISFQSGTIGSYGLGATATIEVVAGSVNSVSVNTPINGYQTGDVLIALDSDLGNSGVGANFDYTLGTIANGGVVSQVLITSSGDCKYLAGDQLTALSSLIGGGSGFYWEVTTPTRISSVTPSSEGTGYQVGDVITIDTQDVGGGTGSGFEYTITNFGTVLSVVFSNPGSNYAATDILTVDDAVDLGGTGQGFSYTVSAVDTTRTTTLTPNGHGYFSSSVGVAIDIANDVPLDKSFVNGGDSLFKGKSNFEDQVLLGNGTSLVPALSFINKPSVGIYTSTEPVGDPVQNEMLFTGGGGRVFGVSTEEALFFKSINFSISQIGDFTYSKGSGYGTGIYTNQSLFGGSGSGAVIDFTVGFATTITNSGLGYGADYTHENVSVTGGSGSGAIARVTTDITQNIISIEIVDPGSGYLVGDVLGLDETTLDQSATPSVSTPASFTITKLNVVSYVNLVDAGSSYELGDILTFPPNVFASGEGFNLFVNSIIEEQLGRFETVEDLPNNKIRGRLSLKSFAATDDSLGIVVGEDRDLSLTFDTILKNTSGNLKIGTVGTEDIIDIVGTSAIKVPSGTESQRPQNPVAGSIRFNTTGQSYEAYDGANWGSLGGTRDVDGNTYILPESAPGENENILFFYNDGVNSLDVEQSKINLYTATTIESLITGASSTNVVPWEAGAAATAAVLPLVNYVHYNYNLYSVDTTGTLDAATPPTHTTGTVTNGTVDLTYVSSTYGNLTVNAAQVGVYAESGVNINNLGFNWDGTTGELTVNGFQNTLKIGSGGNTPEYSLLNITSGGALQVNTSFGSAEAYTTVLDSGLRNFQLRDTQFVSTKSTLVKGTNNSASFVLYDPTTSVGSKVTVVADNTTAGEKEILELSVIDSGSDIYNIEIGDVYTSASKIIDVELDFNPSGNVRLTYLLDASVATADNVVVTVISQRIKK